MNTVSEGNPISDHRSDPREEPSGDFVLAIDFGGTKVALATADFTGRLLEQTRLETNAAHGALQVLERTFLAAHPLIERTEAGTGGRCVAAGVISPGVILPDRILLAPNIPGWGEIALLDSMRAGLGMARVAVGNDVKAAAAAEVRWGSLQRADPAIYLSLGTGVAVALVVNGQPLAGAHGASGEFGYNLRSVSDTRGAADDCAPLEECIGGKAVGERGSLLLGTNVSTADLFASSNPRALALIDEVLAELALHITNMAIVLDPARVAVGGGWMAAGDRILAALKARFSFAVPFPPVVVPAKFVHDA
ncbi:MAG TPA: ROK family protein, partial [Ktedonobacteraceae bacterium]